MAKKKFKQVLSTTKKKSNRRESEIEREYYEDFEVIDPKTGKKTIQKVKITRYKPGPKVDPEVLEELLHEQ